MRPSTSAADQLSTALAAFRQAKRSMDRLSGGTSAADVLRRVRLGTLPREGRTAEGHPYFVHGFGYTLTLESGGDVHLDAAGQDLDSFKVYDIRAYLADVEPAGVPDAARLTPLLDEHARSGSLVPLARGAYGLAPDPADPGRS